MEDSVFTHLLDRHQWEVLRNVKKRLSDSQRAELIAAATKYADDPDIVQMLEEKVKQLPLPDPVKKYVLFSDLEPEDGNSDAIAVGDMLCQDLALQYSIASASDDLTDPVFS
nr:hypothetical protein BaRGS_011912 [Batillaria attramentaria]